MKATHFIEVYASDISGARNARLLRIESLDEELAYTAKCNLKTVAIFKVKEKQTIKFYQL